MSLPRMRTIAAAYAELKKLDPGTALSQNQLRVMVKSGNVPSVKAGSHSLINLDLLIDYLNSPEYQNGEAEKPAREYGKLRRIEE